MKKCLLRKFFSYTSDSFSFFTRRRNQIIVNSICIFVLYLHQKSLSTQTVPLFFICLRNNCKFELYLSSLFASEIIVNLNCTLPFFLIAAIIIVNSNLTRILLLFLTQTILVKSWRTFFLYLPRHYSQVVPYLSSTVYWPREVIAKSYRTFLLFCWS